MFCLPCCNSLGPCRCLAPLVAIRSAPVDVLPPVLQSARPLSMFCPPCCNSLGPCRCFAPLLQFARSLSVFWPLVAIRSPPVGVLPPLFFWASPSLVKDLLSLLKKPERLYPPPRFRRTEGGGTTFSCHFARSLYFGSVS